MINVLKKGIKNLSKSVLIASRDKKVSQMTFELLTTCSPKLKKNYFILNTVKPPLNIKIDGSLRGRREYIAFDDFEYTFLHTFRISLLYSI